MSAHFLVVTNDGDEHPIDANHQATTGGRSTFYTADLDVVASYAVDSIAKIRTL